MSTLDQADTWSVPQTSEADQRLVNALRSAFQDVVAELMADRASDEVRLRTPREAAELLGVTENWISERIKGRRIPCTFIGRSPRLSLAHIRAIAAQGEVDPSTHGRRSGKKR